jgi:multiple sugar transport system substrate-binding protein
MKKGWKRIALLLAVVMSISFTGCGVNVSNKGDADNAGVTNNEGKDTSQDSNGEEASNGEIVLKIVDWSDSTKVRREAFHKKFMEENPNIKIEYTVLTADQFKETVISAIKAGNAPDLFPIPSGFKLSTAVEENWYMPMNDYVTDDFFGTFSEGALNEGITTLDGNVYVLPESANIINTLMFYNKNVLKEAGIDEANLPKTWSEFREICKQITEAGKGKFYGVIDSGAQTNRLELFIRSLASLEGAKTSDISQIIMVDGKNTLNSEGMVKAFDFYSSLVEDGSFHPNSTTLKAPEARALFAQNQAAFIVQGAWCISTWRAENPDLDFGVMALPTPDDGAKGKLPYVGAQAWMGISSNCKNPEAAAKYLEALYSEDYQAGLVEDGGFVSVVDAVNEKNMVDPVMLEYYKLNGEAAALAPDPIVANPDTSLVYAEVQAVTPSLGEIVQGVLAQSVDYKAELAILSDHTQTMWEDSIKKVADSGVSISAGDFEFKNWNPMENYTAEKYMQR